MISEESPLHFLDHDVERYTSSLTLSVTFSFIQTFLLSLSLTLFSYDQNNRLFDDFFV